jgi:ABC-type sugar transport system ATPase subunit
MPTLQIDGLKKRYGGLVALDGARLHAAGGEVHALLGENGAGKSTLIRILSGVIRPDAGLILLDSDRLNLDSPAAARAAGIRTVFQELSLVPDLSVAENLLFERPPLGPLGRVRRLRLHAEARELLARHQVEGIDPTAPAGSLGVAQRQLLEIVKALRLAPRLLILDEPTSALAQEESEWVLRTAREVAAAGAIVLLITHRLAEVRAAADRITVLRSGETVAEGTRDELDDDTLIAAMLGRRIERLYPARKGTAGRTLLEVDEFRVGHRLGPVDFRVRAGEVLGIGALQGQGQRQLLMGLGGAVPWRGRLRLEGREFQPRSPGGALAAGVALVPEDRQREGLFLGHSTRRNISISSLSRLTRSHFLLDARREGRTTRASAERMRIPVNRLDQRVGALSGGNQQKVIFGKVLLTEPKLLLLYDCTRGVDVGTKAEIFQVMAELADHGVAVVFYSSDLSELVNMCDRVLVLHDGRVSGIVEGNLSEEQILRLAVGGGGGAGSAPAFEAVGT